jgi:hypothetical protein
VFYKNAPATEDHIHFKRAWQAARLSGKAGRHWTNQRNGKYHADDTKAPKALDDGVLPVGIGAGAGEKNRIWQSAVAGPAATKVLLSVKAADLVNQMLGADCGSLSAAQMCYYTR